MLTTVAAVSGVALSGAIAVVNARKASEEREVAAKSVARAVANMDSASADVAKEVARARTDRDAARAAVDDGMCGLRADIATLRSDAITKNTLSHVAIGKHTHFNHPDGNTYVRPARGDGKVIIGDMAGNGFNVGGAFVKDSGRGAAVRSGNDKKSLFIADANTGTTIIARDPKRRVQIGQHTHFNNPDGNTYIRPARDGKYVQIAERGSDNVRIGAGGVLTVNKDNVYVRGGSSKKHVIIGDDNTNRVEIDPHGKRTVSIGRHTHFNHGSDGNTYIRPGRENGGVTIGDMAGNVLNVGGALIKTKGATYVRSGEDKKTLYIADSNTGSTIIAPHPTRRVQIGQHTHFNSQNGDTLIRPGKAGGSVRLGSNRYNPTKRVVVESEAGLCIGNTCMNEATLKQVLASTESTE